MRNSPQNLTSIHLLTLTLAIVTIALVVASALLPAQRALFGVGLRLVFAVACFINALPLLRSGAKVRGGLLLAVGLGLTLTALFGWGFNGQPPLQP
jgi:hypothetical protein